MIDMDNRRLYHVDRASPLGIRIGRVLRHNEETAAAFDEYIERWAPGARCGFTQGGELVAVEIDSPPAGWTTWPPRAGCMGPSKHARPSMRDAATEARNAMRALPKALEESALCEALRLHAEPYETERGLVISWPDVAEIGGVLVLCAHKSTAVPDEAEPLKYSEYFALVEADENG
jgi:hypothetical protein